MDDECQRVVTDTGRGDGKGDFCRFIQREVVNVAGVSESDPFIVLGLDVHIGTAIFYQFIDSITIDVVFDEEIVIAVVGAVVEDRILFDFDIVVDFGIGFCFNVIGVRTEHQIVEATFVFAIFVIILGGGGSGDKDEIVAAVERVESEFRVAGGFKLHVEFCGAVDRELQIVDLVIGIEMAVC